MARCSDVERPRREVRVLFEHELLDASYARSEGGERGASPHIHLEHVDAFYIVEGELSFVVGPDLDVVAYVYFNRSQDAATVLPR